MICKRNPFRLWFSKKNKQKTAQKTSEEREKDLVSKLHPKLQKGYLYRKEAN